MNQSKIIKNMLYSLIYACGLLGITLTASSQQANDVTKNEELTTAAWNSFNAGKYEEAIKKASICIDEFQGQADRLQAKLQKEKPEPPTGSVNKSVKEKILANGPLNDVAACYFIKGRSAEKLGKKEDAMRAYEAAQKYTCARTWDPKGKAFWSPAEIAIDRLNGLK